jgi:hypothetical protein
LFFPQFSENRDTRKKNGILKTVKGARESVIKEMEEVKECEKEKVRGDEDKRRKEIGLLKFMIAKCILVERNLSDGENQKRMFTVTILPISLDLFMILEESCFLSDACNGDSSVVDIISSSLSLLLFFQSSCILWFLSCSSFITPPLPTLPSRSEQEKRRRKNGFKERENSQARRKKRMEGEWEWKMKMKMKKRRRKRREVGIRKR